MLSRSAYPVNVLAVGRPNTFRISEHLRSTSNIKDTCRIGQPNRLPRKLILLFALQCEAIRCELGHRRSNPAPSALLESVRLTGILHKARCVKLPSNGVVPCRRRLSTLLLCVCAVCCHGHGRIRHPYHAHHGSDRQNSGHQVGLVWRRGRRNSARGLTTHDLFEVHGHRPPRRVRHSVSARIFCGQGLHRPTLPHALLQSRRHQAPGERPQLQHRRLATRRWQIAARRESRLQSTANNAVASPPWGAAQPTTQCLCTEA